METLFNMLSGNTFGVTQEGIYKCIRESGLFDLMKIFMGQFTKGQKIEFGKLGAIGSLIDVINTIFFKETRKSNGKIILRRASIRFTYFENNF